MTQNPPLLRPDLAPAPVFDITRRDGQPTIGMVSLGCPKALVDSERILTRLRAEGYAISPDYKGADAVIVVIVPMDAIPIGHSLGGGRGGRMRGHGNGGASSDGTDDGKGGKRQFEFHDSVLLLHHIRGDVATLAWAC